MNAVKAEIAEITNRECRRGTLKKQSQEPMFIGVSAPGTLTEEMVASMAGGCDYIACANPTPEIYPEQAKAAGARVWQPAAVIIPTR